MPRPQLIIFTDLDGCLLNKHDYAWKDAEPCLQRLKSLNIPVVLSSSKTVSEIAHLAQQLPMIPAPFAAENGGAICWRSLQSAEEPDSEIHGADRTKILELLDELRAEFAFRSFRDLGLNGVIEATDLTADAATRAVERQSTEPLLWDDTDERQLPFAERLQAAGLTFTRGGRFWHVAGPTSKGAALNVIADRYRKQSPIVTVAIGDSPIDQSMLDVVDFPVGIRVAGKLSVKVTSSDGIVPSSEGALGWNEAVTAVLTQLGYDDTGEKS